VIYLANASSEIVREALRTDPRLGMMSTPAEGRSPQGYLWWAADNGCFGKGYPGDQQWVEWLRRHQAYVERCLFATAPDVVGDAAATLRRSEPWLPVIREIGYPAALVAQNGLEDELIPWDEFDCLFLGGGVECPEHGFVKNPIRVGRGSNQRALCPDCGLVATEWKLGKAAADLANQALSHGKWVHMGRLNSGKRFKYARDEVGCHSADGTFLAFGPDTNLPRLLRWMA
jgi:hypothetical protein